MSQTVHVPDDLAQRLVAEAERRRVSIDEVVTEALIARFPDSGTNSGQDALEEFIGSGSSGRRELFDIHQERAWLAKRKLAEGALARQVAVAVDTGVMLSAANTDEPGH